MRFLFKTVSVCSILALTTMTSTARSFNDFLDEVKVQALTAGVSEKAINQTLPTIRYVDKVIQLDRKQSEFTITFEKYQENQLPMSRVKKAVNFLKQNKSTFDALEAKYKVPREQIVALWAIESNFGQNTGGFHVPSVLATLAYDGRRSELFMKQLIDALKIIDHGDIEPENMKGSWAGAMGQSQFMPSSFLSYAVDHTGDGTADIWRAKADVWASIANYLATEGWQFGNPTTARAYLPQGFQITEALEKEYRPLSDLRQMGVQVSTNLPPNTLVRLIEPDRSTEKQAFVTFNNFYVLLHWNRSYFFALTAARLAEKIKENY